MIIMLALYIYAILPEGMVVNETLFFSFLVIMLILLVIAFILRRRRIGTNEPKSN